MRNDHEMMEVALTRGDVLRRIREMEPEIRALGVRRLALFGSMLRDDARPDSDVDVLVEFEPGAKSFDSFMLLADLLEGSLQRSVELITIEALSPYIGPKILESAADVL